MKLEDIAKDLKVRLARSIEVEPEKPSFASSCARESTSKRISLLP
jgi:hypothetical protein